MALLKTIFQRARAIDPSTTEVCVSGSEQKTEGAD